MDLRVTKTLSAIEAAFTRLMQTTDVDGITVKALCDAAQINKTTFYAHYPGMYALVEQMEAKAIDEICTQNQISRQSLLEPSAFFMRMLDACAADSLANRFLCGSRRSAFVAKLFDRVQADFSAAFPALCADEGLPWVLAFTFHGLMGVTASYDRLRDDRQLMADRLGSCVSLIFQQVLRGQG